LRIETGHHFRYNCSRSQLIKEEKGKAMVSPLVDLVVMGGSIEFGTSKKGKVKDPKAGGYRLTADNEPTRNAYKNSKEERPLRQEKELVQR
jgi:hypothetical protein